MSNEHSVIQYKEQTTEDGKRFGLVPLGIQHYCCLDMDLLYLSLGSKRIADISSGDGTEAEKLALEVKTKTCDDWEIQYFTHCPFCGQPFAFEFVRKTVMILESVIKDYAWIELSEEEYNAKPKVSGDKK